MKRIVCEMCGGTDLVKQDGVYVCQSCGTKYSVEEAKKMMVEISGTVDVSGSTVKVDNSGMVESYLNMAESALKSGNLSEAESYANKIIELSPEHSRAWYIKGTAAGWQTSTDNNRYVECINAYIKSFALANDEEKIELQDEIKNQARNISAALLRMVCGNFAAYPNKNYSIIVKNTLTTIDNQLGNLRDRTALYVNTEDFRAALAAEINESVSKAYNNAVNMFGNDRSFQTYQRWKQFTESLTECNVLLIDAEARSFDDNLYCNIIDNFVTIGSKKKNSCSYTYSGGSYVREYSFTADSQNIQQNLINEYQGKRKAHEYSARKGRADELMSLFNSDTSNNLAKKQAYDNYWNEHREDKEKIEKEIETYKKEKLKLNEEIHNISPVDTYELDKTQNLINGLLKQYNSLGLFKGKEKKAVLEEIDKAKAEKSKLEAVIEKEKQIKNCEKKNIEKKIDNIEREIEKLRAELEKDRGYAKVIPAVTVKVFSKTDGNIVPNALADYFESMIPKQYMLRDSRIEDHSVMMALFRQASDALLYGNLEDFKLDYEDTQEKYKEYRINFNDSDGEGTHTSVNFVSKGVDYPITDEISFQLESDNSDKTTKMTKDFMNIVFATIIGICPNIDLKQLVTMAASAPFGISTPSITADGLKISSVGSVKGTAVIRIVPDS